jgi:hypothetical protein
MRFKNVREVLFNYLKHGCVKAMELYGTIGIESIFLTLITKTGAQVEEIPVASINNPNDLAQRTWEHCDFVCYVNWFR